MNYFDTDTTQTGWSNFGQQDNLEYYPTTGVSRTPDNPELGSSPTQPMGIQMQIERQTKAELGAMFNKFLYQK